MINNHPGAHDPRDEWVECSSCGNVMLPLADYEISSASESPDISAEPLEFLLLGWWAFALNFFESLFSFGGRKSQLAALKRDVLPQFPRSLVCPRCFHVTKRV